MLAKISLASSEVFWRAKKHKTTKKQQKTHRDLSKSILPPTRRIKSQQAS